jgi:hypothetical protein
VTRAVEVVQVDDVSAALDQAVAADGTGEKA